MLDPDEIARRQEQAKKDRAQATIDALNRKYGSKLTMDDFGGQGDIGITGVGTDAEAAQAANVLGVIAKAVPNPISMLMAIASKASLANITANQIGDIVGSVMGGHNVGGMSALGSGGNNPADANNDATAAAMDSLGLTGGALQGLATAATNASTQGLGEAAEGGGGGSSSGGNVGSGGGGDDFGGY